MAVTPDSLLRPTERARQWANLQIALVVMAAFLLVGVLGFLVTRDAGRRDLERTQTDILEDVAQTIDAWWLTAETDINFLANSAAVRTFVEAAQRAVTGDVNVSSVQAPIIQTFVSTLERNRSVYLGIRYVTASGTTWTEVSNFDGTTRVEPAAFTNADFDADLLEQGLRTSVNSVTVTNVRFLTYPGSPDELVEPLVPYLRFMAPIDIGGSMAGASGIIELDVALWPVLDAIAQAADRPDFQGTSGRRLGLLDAQRNLLNDTTLLNSNILRRLANGFGLPLASQLPDLDSVLADSSEGLRAYVSAGWMASTLPLRVTDPAGARWQLLLVDDLGAALDSATLSGAVVFILSLGLGGIVSYLLTRTLSSSLRPFETASALARQIKGDQTEPAVPLPGAADGMNEIVQAFEHLRREINDLSQTLDLRTERYRRNVEIATRISRETALMRDSDALLNRAIDLICSEFGFYHAQIFLVDDVSAYAVLRYSHGMAGQRLLAQGHKLAVGSQSVIGRVTAERRPVIVNNTADKQGEPHLFNPILATTRAEMALPLSIGGQVIGALDIQSEEPDAFREDELQIFQLLADQISIAVQNARLLVESQARVQQIERLNQQFTQGAWQSALDSGSVSDRYHYDLMDVEASEPQTPQPGYRVPISIRGVVVGEIEAAIEADQPFTSGDQAFIRAIADRVGLAIENARLLVETQVSLTETFVLYQLSRELGAAESLEDILRAIVSIAVPQAAGAQIGIFDDTDTAGAPTLIEIRAAVGGDTLIDPTGTRLRLSEHTLLSQMQGEIVLLENIERDRRIDPALRALLHDALGARAAVIIPLNVRGVWRGILWIGYAAPRRFDERDGRLFNALIDQVGVTVDNRLLLVQNEMALAQIERLYGGSRVVNMAQSLQDVVKAAVVTNSDLSIGFELALLEGDVDELGWPTTMRIVARSQGINVLAVDETYPLQIDPESPLRQREPHTLLADKTDFADYMRRHRYRFAIAFPMFSVNQPIAIFFVVSEERPDLSQDDFEIYRALTGQMSTVLQNHRLLEQTTVALDETRRLYEASRAIAAAQDAQAVYEATARHLAAANGAITRACVLLGDGSGSLDAPYVEYAYVWTRAPGFASDMKPGVRLSADLISFGRLILANGSVVSLRNLHETLPAQGQSSLLAVLDRSGSTSALIVSLQTRQQWLGLLLLESDQPNPFGPQFAPFAQAVGDQLAIAVDSLRSFAEAQTQARRALALAEAGQLAGRIGSDLAPSLEVVFSRVAEAAAYTRWQLVIAEQGGRYLEQIIGQTGDTDGFPTRYDLPTDAHPVIEAYRTGRTLIINDPRSARTLATVTSEMCTDMGKFIVTPVKIGVERLGVIMLGRAFDRENLTDRDEQLAVTLASQVAIALENRRLLRASESERETLRSILETLPAGVIVLDAHTLRPLQSNHQAQVLLGQPIESDMVFNVETFNLYRTGTEVLYPTAELPVFRALNQRRQEFSDDVTAVRPDGTSVDLLLNAAPIIDSDGEISAIIVAFQDISTLRSLENTLQENLRETITLYETTRALAEASEVEEIFDLILAQLMSQEADDIYLLQLDESGGGVRVVRTLGGSLDGFSLPDTLLDATNALFVGDIHQRHAPLDADTRAALAAQGIRAVVSLPMRARFRAGAPLGWAVLAFKQPQQFTIEREQSLNTLIENAAVTLDNRYLFERTQVALDTTAALYRATADINRAQQIFELAESLDRAFGWLKADMYAAYLQLGARFNELLNVSLDGGQVDFFSLLQQHPVTGNIFIDDLLSIEAPTPFEQALREIGTIRAFGLVAMRLQNRPGGYLLVAYHQPRRFTDSDERYLSALADGAAVVSENALLLDQIQLALQETSTMYLTSRDLNDAVTEQDVLNVAVEHLVDRPMTQAFVLTYTHTDANPALYIAASWRDEHAETIDLSGVAFNEENFPAWRILTSPELLLIDDAETDPRLNEMERMSLLSLDLRSLSILPLQASDRLLGTIVLGHAKPYSHTDRDERVYRSFVEQATLRLEASRLFAQTERRARQLATSARVGQLASSLEELEHLLPTVVDLIKESFGYDHAQIFLMDAEDRFAELVASTGSAGEQLLAMRHKLAKGSQSVIGRVTASGEPVLALDTADARAVHRPNPYLPNTRSEIAVPLLLKGRVIGALDVQSNTPNFFTEDDVSVLTTLAAQISVAIDNSQLYEQSQARAKDMYFLFTVATAAAGAETLDETMQNITVALQELMEASTVTVYLPVKLTDGETTIVELRPYAIAGTDMPLSEIAEVRLGYTQNLLAQAAEELRPYIIGDIEQQTDYFPIMENARSAIVVPLSVGSRLVALLTLESAVPNAYNDDTLTLLLTLSGALSAIVQSQQLLEELQRTNEQLLELDRLKSDFLANMSHELRTPLNSIIGFSRVILKGIDGPLTEMQEQDLSTIYNSGQHLLNLINDILDQAKIAAGKMDLQIDYFDMRPVIESVRSIGIGLVKDKPIDMIVHLEPGLPKAYADEFRIRQVLLNLVSNAAKFTREGSVTISAYVVDDEVTGRGMMRIDVTDTGIGIAEKDLPLLFEAFRQVDSSLTKTQSGTGLGLPIAKSLVEMQNGRIIVQSQVNLGSTFSILLPLHPMEAPTRSTREGEAVKLEPVRRGVTQSLDPNALPQHVRDQIDPPPSQETEKQPLMMAQRPMQGKRQLLLIEDNVDLVDQFRRTFQRDGFDVFTASIPLEAEAMASGLHPTVIVLDLNFANDSGWQILERLKQRDDTVDIPVIVVSLADEGEQALDAGAFQFIRKPFTPETISQAAREAEREAQRDRILIIDDEPESVRLLKDVLSEAGKYRIFSATNGIEGISMIARRRPDLVIVDLRMPEMDGFHVIEELRTNPETAAIPIVVVTGDTLNAQEMHRLAQHKVVYKADIDPDGTRKFVDTIKSQLSRTNGDH